MAIIVITLNTDNGDTLQGVVDAILADLSAPQSGFNLKAVDGSPGFWKGEVTSVKNGQGAGVAADFQPSTIKATVGSVTTQGPDPDAKWPEPSLGPMDGDRKRGEPGAGHRRRTNKQIEEDEAYFKQRGHAAVATMEMGAEKSAIPMRYFYHPESDCLFKALKHPTEPMVEEIDYERYLEIEAKQKAAISTGAERTNPEDDAQDAADEAAEFAAKRGDAPTLDDLRKVIGEYQKKFGMAQAAAKSLEYNGGQPIFEVPSKDVPLVIARWQTAIEHDKPGEAAKFTPVKKDEPHKVEKVITKSGVVQGTPAPATREEVNAAINDYATRFDGSLDPAKMTHTKADIPRIMERLFGADKNNFNAIERTPENYGRVIAAIQAEIGANTFGRTAR